MRLKTASGWRTAIMGRAGDREAVIVGREPRRAGSSGGEPEGRAATCSLVTLLVPVSGY